MSIDVRKYLTKHYLMKIEWQKWNVGGKTIFVALCSAVASMLMNWVDIGFVSQSGLSQGAFMLLAFWIYPSIILFNQRPINKLWGGLSSLGSVLSACGYISSKSIELFGETLNASAGGAYLFLIASIALLVGVLKYELTVSKTQP